MIIIVALVLALVMFGKNPVKEMQQKAAEMRKKYGSDPLTQETNMFIEKKQKESGSGSWTSGGDGTKVAPADAVGADVSKNGYAPKDELSRPAVSRSSGGYYPPLVGSGDVGKGKNSEPSGAKIENKLRSGQEIEFDGVKVYAVDKAGNKTALPDGKYTL